MNESAEGPTSPTGDSTNGLSGRTDRSMSFLDRILGGRLQAVFLKGLFTLLPLLLTIFLLFWAVGTLERTFGDAVFAFLPDGLYVPGLGLLVAVLVIFATGLLVENYLAGNFLKRVEAALKRAPVIRAIYSPLRDLTDLFSRTQGPGGGQRVVFVQMTNGVEALGLVMRDRFDDLDGSRGEKTVRSGTVAVFIPFSYGFGGITLLVSPSALRDAGLPAERALQLAITGWVKASHDTAKSSPLQRPGNGPNP